MKHVFLIALVATVFVSHPLRAQTIMNIHQSNGTVLQLPISTIDSITYTMNNPGSLAAISTLPAVDVSSNSCTSGGNVTSNGGSVVTQRGVCYAIVPNPTTDDSVTNNGSGTGSFTATINGLMANTTYYMRAFAVNSTGTAYGNEVNFTTAAGATPHTCGTANVHNPDLTYGTMTDQQGNVYKTIVIGTQEWMAENLNTSIYRNGDAIPTNLSDSEWSATSNGAWAYYNNDPSYSCPYGKLYNWYTCVDARQLCPEGWHLPTDAEWTVLTDYLGGEDIAGGKMKTTGNIEGATGVWYSPNQGAINSSGFSGVPGGGRLTNGDYATIGDEGYWWSSSESGTNIAFHRNMSFNDDDAIRLYNFKRVGFAVRCLSD
jgi:uncharacterized protein (TIGR02145 family)